jgi:hypothetical protein
MEGRRGGKDDKIYECTVCNEATKLEEKEESRGEDRTYKGREKGGQEGGKVGGKEGGKERGKEGGREKFTSAMFNQSRASAKPASRSFSSPSLGRSKPVRVSSQTANASFGPPCWPKEGGREGGREEVGGQGGEWAMGRPSMERRRSLGTLGEDESIGWGQCW